MPKLSRFSGAFHSTDRNKHMNHLSQVLKSTY
jgi:hypothetical protein